MKTLLLPLICFLSLSAYSQNYLGHNIYSYGKIEKSISGNTVVIFNSIDPRDQISIMDRIDQFGVKTISWNDFFLPGVSYSEEEVNSFLDSMNISSMIIIKLASVNSYNQSLANSFYSSLSNSIFTTGSNYRVVDNVSLNFEIYNRTNNLNRPIAVLIAKGKNNWGAWGSADGTAYRAIKKVLKTLNKNGAFIDSTPFQNDNDYDLDEYMNN